MRPLRVILGAASMNHSRQLDCPNRLKMSLRVIRNRYAMSALGPVHPYLRKSRPSAEIDVKGQQQT
jgi:hypothetical protein